jgi:hypothetical protein
MKLNPWNLVSEEADSTVEIEDLAETEEIASKKFERIPKKGILSFLLEIYHPNFRYF